MEMKVVSFTESALSDGIKQLKEIQSDVWKIIERMNQ